MNNIIKSIVIAGFMQHFVLASEARIDYVAEVNRLFAPLEQRAAQHAMERNHQNDLIQSLTNQLALSQKELADTKVTLALKERDADVMTATLTDKLSTMTQDRDHWKAAHDACVARENLIHTPITQDNIAVFQQKYQEPSQMLEDLDRKLSAYFGCEE